MEKLIEKLASSENSEVYQAAFFCRFISIVKGNPYSTFFISEVVMVVPDFQEQKWGDFPPPTTILVRTQRNMLLNGAISYFNILGSVLTETVLKRHSKPHWRVNLTSENFKKSKFLFLFELSIFIWEVLNFSYFYRPSEFTSSWKFLVRHCSVPSRFKIIAVNHYGRPKMSPKNDQERIL